MSTLIEVFSDFVCPFCYLAEQPLADAVEGADVQIAWQPFELRPEPHADVAARGRLPPVDLAAGGLPDGRAHGRPDRAAQSVAAALQPAGLRGFRLRRGTWRRAAVHRANVPGVFVEQRDIGRPEVLADIAAELGLDADDFRAALDSGRYAEAHRQALHRARQLQITVVPTFLFDGQRLEGMPTAEGLNRLLNSAAVVL